MAEATEYLKHDALRARLIEMTRAVADQVRQGHSLQAVMGSPIDVLKLVSSLTLFGGVARRLACEDPTGEFETLAVVIEGILDAAQADGFPRCERTLESCSASRSEGGVSSQRTCGSFAPSPEPHASTSSSDRCSFGVWSSALSPGP